MMNEKIFIYQVLPRLFGNNKITNTPNGSITENGVGKFSCFSDIALQEIKKMGFSHIWFTGILEHATKTDYSDYGIRKDHPDVVKGQAGSPYAIKDYYDVSPDLADNVDQRIDEFENLIQRTHNNGLKVIIDFVPNHVARQYHSDAAPKKTVDFGANDDKNENFAADNNFYYIPNSQLELNFDCEHGANGYVEYPAKVTGNDCFNNCPTKNDWYDTVKLNYGVDYLHNKTHHFMPVPDTWYKMKDVLEYWANKGVDGFRCDMAEMVPVEFWNWTIPKIKQVGNAPIFIAEIYNPDQYQNYIHCGLFDYLYDKVGLYDTLRAVICEQKPTSEITFSWQRLNNIQDKMLNFLENHDEQRIGSDFFAGNPEKGVPGMLVSAAMNTNPVMIYFGQEIGERGMEREGFSGIDGRTSIFDYWTIDSIRRWINNQKFGQELLNENEIKLKYFYTHLIEICRSEKCISQGSFYDLMYANYENNFFDSTRQYAFLRCFENTFLLIVANFGENDADIAVCIPREAFDFMHIDPETIVSATDILNDNKQLDPTLSDESFFHLRIKRYSGKIIKFSLSIH